MRYLRTALTMSAAAGALLSCSDSTSPNKSGTFFGPTVAMGSGTARAYVVLDRVGAPGVTQRRRSATASRSPKPSSTARMTARSRSRNR